MRKIIIFICLGLAILGLSGGCSVTKMVEEETKPITYTIIPQEEMPTEILNLIEGKKEKAFQLTYQDENYLYLIRGYGRQNTGGYSIQIENLSESKSAIFLTTNLLGPSKEEEKIKEPSYPYIVICIKYRELPVQFQ